MADGDETSTARPLRRAAPTFDGPLASSGAAPEPARPAGPAPDAAPPALIPEQRTATDPPAPAQPDPAEPPKAPDPPEPRAPDVPEAPQPPDAPEPRAPDTPDTPDTREAPQPPDPPEPTGADPATPAGAPVAVGAATPARRLRIPNPRRFAASSIRATRDWSRRPAGKLAIPGLSLLLVVVATGVAGAVLVPAAGRGPQATGATATPDQASLPPSAVTPGPGLPTPDLPGGLPPLGQPTADPIGGAPGEVLTDWATQVGQRVVVSEVAMRAYGYAELVLARTTPGCQLTWTTLAAIGLVESNHGRANGATLQSDGLASPHIIGLPLDGKGDRQLIADTDGGAMDGDPVYDRAVGPMQFIPTTWDENGADADNDGVKNPHDIDDAALAAGNYLCKGGRNLSTAQDWWNAILSYNDVRPYAQAVFEAANRYGTESRT